MTFDDVIEKVVAADFPSELIPTFDLLIIDEAQDLSNHLWKFAKKLISNARTTFIAGDADQAIMIGIGANPDAFVGLKTSENDDALKSSFRVPKTSRSYAEKGIIKALEKLPNRVGVSWDPANREGYLNAGFRTLEQHPEHGPVIVGHEFSIDYLLQRIKQHYLLFGSGETEFNDNLFLQNSEFIIRQTLRLNQITNVKISELLEAAVTELDVKDLRDLQIKIGKGEILASEVIGCGVMDGDLVDLESLPDIDDTVDVPDWLVMAPTKRTGEQLSKALEEINVPHFHRNKPILHAEKEQTLIRVQTVHMSKGDEATNAAIVVGSEGDVRMLADDVRLAYVAATRASHACFPRVARKDLLPMMYSNQYWRPIVRSYNSIFPIG
jgi:uncharacterized protein YecA (UPF0149 family)